MPTVSRLTAGRDTHFGDESVPVIGINIAIIQDAQVLLTKRSDFPVWCLPGGEVDAGESLAQAALREAREETGLSVELTRLVGVYSRPQWWTGHHEVLFAARSIGGDLRLHDQETVDLGFFHRDQLPNTLLWWYHQRILDALDQVIGVARLQDVTWSLAGQSRQELYQARDQGLIPPETFIEHMCGQRRQDKEKLEVPATQYTG